MVLGFSISNYLILSNLQGYFHFCHLADILPPTPDILLPSETNERGNPLKTQCYENTARFI